MALIYSASTIYVTWLFSSGTEFPFCLAIIPSASVRRRVNDACLTSVEIHFTRKGIANKLHARFPLKFRFAPIVFGTRGVLLWSEPYLLQPFRILIYKVHNPVFGRSVKPKGRNKNKSDARFLEILHFFPSLFSKYFRPIRKLIKVLQKKILITNIKKN